MNLGQQGQVAGVAPVQRVCPADVVGGRHRNVVARMGGSFQAWAMRVVVRLGHCGSRHPDDSIPHRCVIVTIGASNRQSK